MARNKKYEEPVGMGGEEDVVSHAEDFRLDDIDFDEAYDQLKDEPPEMDEKTQKSILKLRREVELEDKYVAKLRKRNRTRWVRAFVIPLCIVAVSAGIALMIMAGIRDMIGIEKNEFYREELEITEGMTADQVADLLGEKGIINYPWLFKIIVKLDGVGQNFQAGMHEFYPHDSYSELVVELETTPERTDVADVMIPEGYTLPQIAQTLEVNGICSAADFIKTVNSMEIPYDFASSIDQDALKFYRVEGYLFPDQYRFYLNEKPEVVANKFFENFQAKIAPYEEQIAQSGYTLEEVVTLASIIQCEAADEEQMKTISSVFHNRLKSSDFPHLETDPTTKYIDEVIRENIDTPDQAIFDAYDSKVCTGLPVGPIANPGAAALEAALDPENTDYYFFVHNVRTGECLYASTYEKHQANCASVGIVG